MARVCIVLFLISSLLMNALCLPLNIMFRERRDTDDNKVGNADSYAVDDIAVYKDPNTTPSAVESTASTSIDNTDDDDDDDFKPTTSNGGSGSGGIFSLLKLATALVPSLSGSNNVKKNNEFVKKTIRDIIKQYQAQKIQKRQDIKNNEIEIDYASQLKPPFYERQETVEAVDDDSDSNSSESESEEDNAAEESVEEANAVSGDSTPKQDSDSKASNANDDSNGSDDDSDYDDLDDGDGQGGGILGLLSGLSGDGESDLGSLLAAVGGIVTNLSGDGVDINALIATALGLFVGLLSDEGSNPGEVIASYLLTSLDTISGGGAKNNGAFFGNFLSSLVKGASAADSDSDSNSGSEENGMKMADSAGFFASLLMGLFGEMSKFSSLSSWR